MNRGILNDETRMECRRYIRTELAGDKWIELLILNLFPGCDILELKNRTLRKRHLYAYNRESPSGVGRATGRWGSFYGILEPLEPQEAATRPGRGIGAVPAGKGFALWPTI